MHLKWRSHLLTPTVMVIANLLLPSLHTRRLLLLSHNIKLIPNLQQHLLIICMSSIHLIHMPTSPSKRRHDHSSWLKPVDQVEPAVRLLTMADRSLLQHPADLLPPMRLPQRISLHRRRTQLSHQHQPCRLHMRMGWLWYQHSPRPHLHLHLHLHLHPQQHHEALIHHILKLRHSPLHSPLHQPTNHVMRLYSRVSQSKLPNRQQGLQQLAWWSSAPCNAK